MKTVFFVLFLCSGLSCSNEPQVLETYQMADPAMEKMDWDKVERTETLHFSDFHDLFIELNLPYSENTRRLYLSHYSAEYFGAVPEEDITVSCIPKHIMDAMVANTELYDQTNLIGNYILREPHYLEDCEDPRGWYRICPHTTFKASNGKQYYVIKEFEQISEVNGSGWTYWLAQVDKNLRITELKKIGSQECYRSSSNDETEEMMLWQESWSYTTSEISFYADSVHASIVEKYVSQRSESGENHQLDTVEWQPDEIEVISVRFEE